MSFRKAEQFESNKQYNFACYEYAKTLYLVDSFEGIFRRKYCRERIKSLWVEFGPFDYSEAEHKIEEMVGVGKPDFRVGCDDRPLYEHYAIVALIKKLNTSPDVVRILP